MSHVALDEDREVVEGVMMIVRCIVDGAAIEGRVTLVVPVVDPPGDAEGGVAAMVRPRVVAVLPVPLAAMSLVKATLVMAIVAAVMATAVAVTIVVTVMATAVVMANRATRAVVPSPVTAVSVAPTVVATVAIVAAMIVMAIAVTMVKGVATRTLVPAAVSIVGQGRTDGYEKTEDPEQDSVGHRLVQDAWY